MIIIIIIIIIIIAGKTDAFHRKGNLVKRTWYPYTTSDKERVIKNAAWASWARLTKYAGESTKRFVYTYLRDKRNVYVFNVLKIYVTFWTFHQEVFGEEIRYIPGDTFVNTLYV
jgi:hypothetical protein